MNLILKGYWSNNPVPVNEVIENPEIVLRVPISTVTLSADVDKAYVDEQDRLLGNEFTTALQTLDDKKANATAVTQALDTKADLIDGVIPANQLPSFVDDVLEGTYVDPVTFNDLQGNPYTPEGGKIYVDVNLNTNYRWSGMLFVTTGGGGVSLGETAATAYRGDRGKIAYDHSQSQGNPHNTTTSEIAEGTNKYFTDLRVRNTVLSGLVKTNSSNVTNTDTIEVAVGKLAAKSEAGGGGSITWVDASTLAGYSKSNNLTAASTKVQFAKINGFIWMRGYITTSNSINTGVALFYFTDSRFVWDNTYLGAFPDNQYAYETVIHRNIKIQEFVEFRLAAKQIGTGTAGNITHRLHIYADANLTSAAYSAIVEPVCLGVAKNP